MIHDLFVHLNIKYSQLLITKIFLIHQRSKSHGLRYNIVRNKRSYNEHNFIIHDFVFKSISKLDQMLVFGITY